MVRKSYVVLVLAVILILPLVFAVQTSLTVKTNANHNLTIYALEPVTGLERGYFKVDSDSSGEASVEVSSESGRLCFSITVRKNGKIIERGHYGNYTAGSPVFIDMTIKEIVEEPEVNETATSEVNETVNETVAESTASETSAETQTEENNEANETTDSGQLTGGVIGNKFIFSRLTYMIIAGAFLCLIVMFFVIKKILSRDPPRYYDYKIRGAGGAEGGYDSKDQKQLLDAEKKIKEAQEDIYQIKNKEKLQKETEEKEKKIKEAEEKFAKAKEDLKKLKKGEEKPSDEESNGDKEDKDNENKDSED